MAKTPTPLTSTITTLLLIFTTTAQQFTYNSFKASNNDLHLDGLAQIFPNGLLQLTNFTMLNTSHAFYSHPMSFNQKNHHSSFSTVFAFAMYPQVANFSGNGIVFVISPSINLQNTTLPQQYLGLFNASSNGNPSSHIFAVEFDTIQNAEVKDIDNDHVGIDENSLVSIDSASASYYSDKERVNKSIRINNGEVMQAWIDYDGVDTLLNVTIAPIDQPKPSVPLLSSRTNLSSILLESMWIGFTSSTGLVSNSHYILGWSWNQSGPAQDLDRSKLPSLPRFSRRKRHNFNEVIVPILLSVVLAMVLIFGGVGWVVRKKKYEELNEPWEQEYAPHRFSYKDLVVATKGFRNSELLGIGGFGKVYKGVLPSTHVQLAVKRISHDSRQGMKEFVAEIASMRRLRHRNLVQLLGYCRRKGELLLVYDYMPYGSLDKYLFSQDEKSKLSWSIRFNVIKGVASALLYLHEDWEQVVVHRDVKAGNVLLDEEMNARLGDFGLARLYDHGIDPQTTRLVGTMGYIAPEASRTRKPTTSTDVFAFGMFLFEVGCGRRPIDHQAGVADDVILVDWVCVCWKRGVIIEASDPRLEGVYDKEEMELVLKLGLLCSHPKAESRPTMRQVVQYLNRTATMPNLPPDYDPEGDAFLVEGWGTSGSLPSSLPSSSGYVSFGPVSSVNSVLYDGR